MSEDAEANAEAEKRWALLNSEERYEYMNRQFWWRWEHGLCPICDVERSGTERIGHCLYALPCNHRLWQCAEGSDDWVSYTMAGMRVRI